MICPHCNIRETKTPKFPWCNACYVKQYQKRRPGYAQFGVNGYKALIRDNYTCQKCKYVHKDPFKRIGKLEIHHIDGNGSTTPVNERNNKLDNLITLCKKCHAEVEMERRQANREKQRKSEWAIDYVDCRICHSTRWRHAIGGLCNSCYPKLLRLHDKYKLFAMRFFIAKCY